MVRYGHVASFFMLVIINVTARYSLKNLEDGSVSLLKGLSSGNRAPLIVLLNTSGKSQPELDSDTDFDDLFFSGDDGVRDANDSGDVAEEAKEEAKEFLYKYLRTSPDDSQKEKDAKQALRAAVKHKCKVTIKCMTDCPTIEVNCMNLCKKKFDLYDICGPPKTKWGRTMPPRWLLL